MKTIYRLETILGGFNVFFSEDGGAIVVAQVYDTDEPQHFTWAEVQANMDKLDKPLPVVERPFTQEVKNEYKDKIEALLPVRREKGFPHAGSTWQGDEGAQLNMASLLNLINLGATGPFIWRDRDNVDHTMTVPEIQALAGPMAMFIQTCFMDTWAAKSAIDEATTEAECQAIVAAEEAK